VKKRCTEILFIICQVFDLTLKRFNLVLSKCDKRESKIGDNYGSDYIRMHAYYYQRIYEKSFDCFVVLLKNYSLNTDAIEWGIKLFIETPIVHEENFNLAKSRILQLEKNTNLDSKYKNKINSILKYIEVSSKHF